VKSIVRVFDKTSCIADYKNLDFAVFTRTCLEHAGAEEEIEVSLNGTKGGGPMLLRAFVKASLLNDLQNYDGEAVSSELSFMSEERTPASALDEEYIDDDDSQVHTQFHTCFFWVESHRCTLWKRSCPLTLVSFCDLPKESTRSDLLVAEQMNN
jgi:hypothetical protein